MPTTLFARRPSGPPPHLDSSADLDRLYIHHHSSPLYIISEQEYVHSLIPNAARREAHHQLKSPSTPFVTSPIASPNRPLNTRKPPRPLMATMTFAESNPALEGAPGSPPDLTNSKSSKSSSFHSESLSDIMGPADLSHFEDINLDDVQGRRSSFSSITSSRSTPHPPSHSFRDLTASAKPRYPSLKGQVNGVVRTTQQQQPGLSAPTRSSMRRGLTSPSAPSLSNTIPRSGRQSRSPSPSNLHSPVFSSAPRSLSRRSSRNLDVSSVSSNNSRRQSWQQGTRKTAKEREAECDDDADEELPEDAVIWNVPMSPRPPNERSPSASTAGSPPIGSVSPAISRRSSQQSQVSNVSAVSGSRKASAAPSPDPSSRDPSQPASGSLSRQRTNTWEETYTTLDPDAKMLTEALEQYQQESELQQDTLRQSKPSPTLSQPPNPRAKTQSLPPLRRSDPLVDPLQPSKEKERYLSRTRPSWLPPKDPKEEKKHLKELQKIEERRLAAERAEAQKAEEQRIAREQAEIVKTDLWRQYLLPNWATEIESKDGRARNRKVWWQGVPSKMRAEVWTRAIGNDLGVTEETYKKALEKALSDEPQNEAERLQFEATKEFVQRESRLVFPECGLFGPGALYHEDLVKLYLAYKEYRPDVPVEMLDGVLHISALLLINMQPSLAFQNLTNLLNRPTPLIFLLNPSPTTTTTPALTIVIETLLLKAPTLHTHLFTTLGLDPASFLPPIFRSLACDRLPLEHAARVMDLFVIEGDRVLTRVAVALLLMLESRLYVERKEEVACVLEGRRGREGGGCAGPGFGGVEEWVGWVVEAGKVEGRK